MTTDAVQYCSEALRVGPNRQPSTGTFSSYDALLADTHDLNSLSQQHNQPY
jgi:hypothetical protein